MKTVLRLLPVAIGLLACGASPALAQRADGPRLDAIWDAYQQLDYARAADSARAALDLHGRYTRRELVDLHTILGLISFSRDQAQEARDQFTTALSLDPDLHLDSLLVSPKILTFFEEVRGAFEQPRRQEDGNPASVRYVIIEDRRSEAALRSMMLPGWGQLHKGERTKGRVLLGLWGTAVAGTVATHLLREQARKDYQAAATPDEALERYDPFNRWHKTRNALVLATAGVWIYSYVDALMAGGPPHDRRLVVAPVFSARRMHLAVRLRF